MQAIIPGDTIFCRVVQKSMSGLMLSVLCLDPITSKSRFIEDIKIRCFCPSAEMIPASDPRDPVRSYESGDIVRVVVLEVGLILEYCSFSDQVFNLHFPGEG